MLSVRCQHLINVLEDVDEQFGSISLSLSSRTQPARERQRLRSCLKYKYRPFGKLRRDVSIDASSSRLLEKEFIFLNVREFASRRYTTRREFSNIIVARHDLCIPTISTAWSRENRIVKVYRTSWYAGNCDSTN